MVWESPRKNQQLILQRIILKLIKKIYHLPLLINSPLLAPTVIKNEYRVEPDLRVVVSNIKRYNFKNLSPCFPSKRENR